MDTITLFISRADDWFFFEDAQLDPCFFAMELLARLQSRPKVGLEYNRVTLLASILNRRGQMALQALDSALVLLSSRELISISEHDDFSCRLFITERGSAALHQFREVLKHAAE